MSDQANAPVAVIVLAAGAGTRMKSAKPKIMHEIAGRSMIAHALHAASALQPKNLVAVVRHQRDLVAEHIVSQFPSITIADQDEIPGTGRAVQQGLEAIDPALEGTVVVTYGDVPLLTSEVLQDLVATHEANRNSVTVLTTSLDDPNGYGRILRDENGDVAGIREQKDASAEELLIKEINSGIYAFDAKMLRSALTEVTTENAQGEMYLTDVLAIARARGGRVASSQIADRWQIEGANDRVQVSNLARIYNQRKAEFWMREGVTIIDPATTWIDAEVIIGRDATLKPGTQLHGTTIIGDNATVGPDTTLTNVVVGQRATVKRTDATDSRISAGASVGPFAYLRPGTELGADGKIGAFYETKNVTIGRGSKLSHLGYAGDAEIGEFTNIGCGNITANYDGEKKHRTKIGSHVRTSSNTVFVAPVEIGDGAYTGAGAIVRKNVPAGALALTVAPQRNTEGWTLEKRPGTPSADAAFKSSLNSSGTE
ncbi:bifunctional UDP-N-acetylglucosamine diphosphorylase/glucosamine-1-phosphate N-acetyltransferase GlmU [Glutamicibacter sp. JL.03c]|uniref:bifunctional UDP-N-acetylglucosamine diphosphorylase/glucosamine-1-phosphate N-acetyltransferase GlmU n=1 Tax=Glutamicibacter sp. JL.03c TaxID=2984842 RepID=UPI0021F6C52E|nr:bifunctional UDP-N-acetylglucosamine diphosphorylase/glucosamine-1-phosphate N-acetyltransferase GlmU [Glutamicibacter sp. JL.03c]UYQ78310.1 bifunctional UDP-N-acetylglucosamine diphosphorylase/glucosamine-1-phosphate N-acetyltransferase GlmU [Glutamicibacter sp. JL.03c]